MLPHGMEPPSGWVQRWAHLLKPSSRVLDVACGHGRHMAFLKGLGHAVCGIDRNPEALRSAATHGRVVQADIENGPWPLNETFDAVVVTNYLWRPLFAHMQQSLAPRGVLIYETFARGNEQVGKPSRPDFLLEPGELLQAFATLRVVAYEHGFLSAPDRYVQRLVAVNDHDMVARWPL